MIFLTKLKKNKYFIFVYKCLFIIGIIIGVKLKTSDIWKIVDSGMVLLGIFNIFVLYKLKKVFHKEMEKFSLIK